jgi:two-component system sensor histidine kinase BaeS
MVREAERMERYVADLLALGRLEADDFTLVDADLDVAEVLAEGARSWAQRFERAGLTLSVEAPDGLALRSDPGRIRQVLDVLTDNALRAGSPGDRVVWAAVASPGGVRLEVRDSGPGLTDADAADAFEPGVLHDRYAGQRPGGQGLGLAIAHGLVTRMGGSIRLERAPEGGAAFVVELPSRHSVP